MATGDRPAAEHIGSKEPGKDSKIEFDNRDMKAGAWPAKTKNGDNYMRGKCPGCGINLWTFFSKKEGWRLVKEDVEAQEDW